MRNRIVDGFFQVFNDEVWKKNIREPVCFRLEHVYIGSVYYQIQIVGLNTL